jgi:protein disulfide-isomerase A6
MKYGLWSFTPLGVDTVRNSSFSFMLLFISYCIEFYVGKSLTPEYKKAASALKGVVKVGAVDATAHESLAQKYQIQGFPTIKIFGSDKRNPVDYQGERTSDGLVNEAMKVVSRTVKERQNGKSSGKGKEDSKSKNTPPKNSKSSSDVVELTDTNFEALVMESNDLWLVEFFAPWCGHCKKLAPEWEAAASQLKGTVRLGAVDATAHTQLASKYGIKGYPTIKVFGAGKKGKATDYQGPRETDGIVQYALNLLESSDVPPQINQLTSNSVFTDSCSQTGKICVVMFVPHILDSQASGRNGYLETLTEVAKEFRGKPFTFIWSEGGAQENLETSMSISFGYPALAVLSSEKKVFAVQKLSWSKKNIVSFLNNVLAGK